MRKQLLFATLVCISMLIAGCTSNSDTDKGKPKDKEAPTALTININEGANYTNNRTVALRVSASDNNGVSDMSFSEDGANWSPWELFSDNKAWNVSQSDGSKEVHFRARDKAGNIATPVKDSITLETTVPTITKMDPAASATGIPITTETISLTFSEDMDTNALFVPPIRVIPDPSAYLKGEMDLEKMTWVNSKQLDMKVKERFQANTTYTVKLDVQLENLHDLAGNTVKTETWSFKTRAGPAVTAFTPTGTGIDLKTNITVTFSRAMNQTTVKEALWIETIGVDGSKLPLVDYDVVWAGNTMTVVPKGFLRFSKLYNVSICGEHDQKCPGNRNIATDSEGGFMQGTVKYTFTTRDPIVLILASTLYHYNGDPSTYAYSVIQNKDNYPIFGLYLKYEFYDLDKKSVWVKDTYMGCNGMDIIVQPDQIIGHQTSVGDKDGKIKSFSVSTGKDPADIQSATTKSTYDAFDIINPSSTWNAGIGIYSVSGKIKNRGDKAMNHVVVLVIFKDNMGALIAATGFDTNPKDIGIGMQSDFSVSTHIFTSEASRVQGWTLLVFGE